MEFSLEINMSNEAFEFWGLEIQRILLKLAKRVSHNINQEPDRGNIIDANGNIVGHWGVG